MEGKKRTLWRWINCSWPLGRGLGCGIMIGSIRQITPYEASSLTWGMLERERQRSVESGSEATVQCWGMGTQQRETNPEKGRKSEVGDIII